MTYIASFKDEFDGLLFFIVVKKEILGLNKLPRASSIDDYI